jgi:tRNA-specific 2-thiouridylase
MRPRVMVAMSGGVDSSVAAALLHQQGYDVVGVAMRLAPETSAHLSRPRGTCCSYDDFEDARRVSERMGFPFYVVDLRNEFENRVIRNFVSEYLNGRTPNPCVMCNREIKFDRLWDRARAFQADFIATGHYARIEQTDIGEFRLLRADDTKKDQSYFLFNLTQRELARTLFPLGAMTKEEVRARARELRLRNADKPESQEICFVPDGDYAKLVERSTMPDKIRAGRILDHSGRLLGYHQGIHRFTIGQRRGLGIAGPHPYFVTSIDADSGAVTVSNIRAGANGLIARDVTLVSATATAEFEAEVKIRYRHPAIRSLVRRYGEDRAQVQLTECVSSITPGQACVFYRGDEVLGGGFIERALES